jgi:hypothetical protein
MKIKITALSAAIVLISASALALATVQALTVKKQVKEGQIVKLALKAELDFQGQPAVFSALSDQTVKKVDADGSYTMEVRQHDMKATVGGQDIDVPEAPAGTVVYNADGSLRSIKGDDQTAGPSVYRFSTLGLIIDSGKPASVGDAWSVDIKADAKTGVEAAKADFKILAEEKVGDIDTIKLSAKIKETSSSEPASSDSTYWLSKTDGTIVKAEENWTNAPFPGSPVPITAKVKVTRQGS